MTIIALSMRRDYDANRNTFVDSISKDLIDFFGADTALIPIPNYASGVRSILTSINVDRIILTGGNSVLGPKDLYPDFVGERNDVEQILLQTAINEDIPILGICRGMQFIAHYFGMDICKIPNHVGKPHAITDLIDCKKYLVNSYHNYGITPTSLHTDFVTTHLSDDGYVEGFRHLTKKITGIMWHPERQMPNPHECETLNRRILR